MSFFLKLVYIKMDKINIITYNILSSKLADLMIAEIKDNKQVYDSNNLNNNNRLEKIKQYLLEQIIKNYDLNLIICLQEVSEEWLPILANFFISNKYKYINIQYGRVFNGNMGILIAYPDYLNIIKSEFYEIGKHIKVNSDNKLKASLKRNNAILLILENSNNNLQFGVTTYHMPCEPTNEYIGYYHSKKLYKKITKFMKNIKYWILAGDFNMLNHTKSYLYLISNCGCIWKDKLKKYPITNHAYINGHEFAGCLDYIFYSKSLSCDDVKYKEINNIIPDNENPSDHIPILASFN